MIVPAGPGHTVHALTRSRETPYPAPSNVVDLELCHAAPRERETQQHRDRKSHRGVDVSQRPVLGGWSAADRFEGQLSDRASGGAGRLELGARVRGVAPRAAGA